MNICPEKLFSAVRLRNRKFGVKSARSRGSSLIRTGRVLTIDWRWSPFLCFNRISRFRSHANNSSMDMAFLWSDQISFFPSHVDPFSLIDTLISFPVDCAESYLIIRVLQFLRFHAPFLSTSWSMSTLAVTFPCRFFFLGSGIDIAFPYLPLPHCRRFSVYHVGKSPTMKPF
jgi:hypothetical protein